MARIVVVTGGASGIGFATARRFVAAGDRVVIADINAQGAAEAVKRLGPAQASAETVDVASADQVAALTQRVEQRIGAVEVLVTCAGVLQGAVTTAAMDLEEHDRIWAVNYRGTYLSCRAFAPLMAARGTGAIVTIGSINTLRPLPLPAYNPGKVAIKALTEILAVEHGGRGVRVNCVAPGYVLTEPFRARIAAGQRDPKAIERTTALGMLIEPDDIAAGIEFLCSDAARAITGVTLPIDAGWLPKIAYMAFPGAVSGA